MRLRELFNNDYEPDKSDIDTVVCGLAEFLRENGIDAKVDPYLGTQIEVWFGDGGMIVLRYVPPSKIMYGYSLYDDVSKKITPNGEHFIGTENIADPNCFDRILANLKKAIKLAE